MYDYHVVPPEIIQKLDDSKQNLTWVDYVLLSCYVGTTITRECSRLAFENKGRAMQTSDLNDRVGIAYQEIIENCK